MDSEGRCAPLGCSHVLWVNGADWPGRVTITVCDIVGINQSSKSAEKKAYFVSLPVPLRTRMDPHAEVTTQAPESH